MRWRPGQELFRLLPAFFFFLIFFALINFTGGLMLREHGIPPYTHFEVFLAALVVAKVLLIADHLPWINLFSNLPLIYKTIWKISLYGFFILILRLSHHLFILQREGCPLSFQRVANETDWAKFWALELWYLIVLFIFVSARELNDALGPNRLRQIFFGKRGR